MRLTKKNLGDEELPHELFLATRQTTKKKKTFAKNMSPDIKLSEAQISKIIHSSGSFFSSLGNIGKKAVTNISTPLDRDIASNAINKFERTISGKGAVRTGKGFTLFISNQDINDIIKIINY